MKFEIYLKALNELAEKRPETKQMEVVYSFDDEGNGFQIVNYDGAIGYFDSEYRGDFTPENQFDKEGITGAANAVCIN